MTIVVGIIKFAAIRKDAREVEWDGLENRYTGNCIEGSNPSLSADKIEPLQIVEFEGVFRSNFFYKFMLF